MEDKVLVGILIGLITGSSIYVWNSESYTKPQKIGLLCCVIFPPLQWLGIIVILIYNNYKTNNSVEKVTERQVEQEKNKLDNSISTLAYLRKKGLLTEEEYNQKVNKIETEKLEQNLKNSTEYKQLKSLLNSNILTKEEFERKSKLIKKPYEKAYDDQKALNKKDNSSNYSIVYKIRIVVSMFLIFFQLINILAVLFKIFFNENYSHLIKDVITIFVFLFIGLLIHPRTIQKLKNIL